MARNRWTLALIIVCLPILATVITAFRVRDLPKSADDSVEKFTKHRIKDSAKSYEELKKAVREKQQLINQKAEGKSGSVFKIISESETDDKEDDDLDVFKSKSDDKTKVNPKLSKVEKSPEPKSVKRVKQDEDDDDHEDDDETQPKNKKVEEHKKIIDGKVKLEPKKDETKIQGKSKTSIEDEDDDDDENDDDDDMNDNKKKSQIVEPTKKDPNKQAKFAVKHESEDSDDDDDEDDDDEDIKHLKKVPSVEVKKDILKQVPKKADIKDKPKPSISTKNNSDEDDDDDDDDDDEDEKDLKKDVKQKSHHNSQKHEKPFPKKDTESKGVKIPDNKLKLETKSQPVESKSEQKKSAPNKETKPNELKLKMIDIKKSESPKEKNPLPPKKEDVKPKLETPKKEVHNDETKKHKEPEKATTKSKPSPKLEDDKKGEKKSDPRKDTKSEASKHKEPKESGETGINKEKEGKNKKKEDSSEVKSSHIDQLTDMLHRRNMLASEFEDFYAFLPTFAPNFSRIHNPECRRHGQILLRQLRGTKLWALNMLDASAKIPSGILQGNGIQLGDFDQCLGSRARVQLETGSVVKVQGKYCLARLDVKAEHQELELPVHLAQAKNLIRSRIDDPGHFVPRFSTLSWGVCVPSPCHPEDAEVVIKDSLKHYQHTSGLVVKVKIDERDCYTHESSWDEWLELPTVLTLSFYGLVILLVLLATVRDYLSSGITEEAPNEDADAADDKAECDQPEAEEGEKEKDDAIKPADGFFSSFSLYRTIPKLTAPGSDDEISCIHGIRGLATIALLIAHKFLPVAVTPYNNRLKITEMVSSPLWSWCRAGWMYTDCFLLLSGALTAHRISADGSGTPKRLLSRYLRLTPALLAVVLFYAFVWDNISTGPLWGTLVTKNAEICQEGWWWNILYVQNWFGFEDMCAPQTHQLALDMQLTIIGGMIVWAMQVKPAIAKVLIPTIIALAAYSRYSTVSEHRLTLLAYHGVSVSQLYRTARLSYTSVYHRCTPYLIGLCLGLALQKPSQLNKILLILGWLSSSALWALVWWAGLDSGYTQYRYSAIFAANYAALAPIAASLAIAWVIYAVHNGHCEFLADFLCCRPLVLISRLSYALYLCQFIVFLTEAATVRTTTEFSLMSLIDLQEISLIMLSSTLLTLTFVIPMQSIHKVFTFSSSSGNVEDKEETEEKPDANHTESNGVQTECEDQEEQIDVPQIKSRQHLVAHRELLEEIPEADIEYEIQRDKMEGLEEILEEEEEEEPDEDEVKENHLNEEDMEVIEEEQGGEDDFWGDRDEDYVPRRAYPVEDDDEDIDEWEWTANGSRNGAQHFRYTR